MSVPYPPQHKPRPQHRNAGLAAPAAQMAQAAQATQVVRQRSEARASSLLFALLAALTVANAGDLFLTAAGVRARGLAAEANPLLHAVMAWGGIPAFVGAKFVCSVAEVLLALLIWSAVRGEHASDRWVVLAALWATVGWMVLLDVWLVVQVAPLLP